MSRKLPPHQPPKTEVERVENVLTGLLDADDDELEPIEDVKREAEAAGIDFAKWGEEIRQKAIMKRMETRKEEIEREQAAYDADVARLASRPRPSGTREEKLALMRSLMKRAESHQLSAHFRKFEEASDSTLDELIVSLEDLLRNDDG